MAESDSNNTGRQAPRLGTEAGQAVPTVNPPARETAPQPEQPAAVDEPPEPARRGNLRPLMLAAAIAVAAGVGGVIGALVTDTLRPRMAVGDAGEAASLSRRVDTLAADVDAIRATLRDQAAAADMRSAASGSGDAGPKPYQPPRRVGDQSAAETPSSAADGAASDTATASESVAVVTPPPPRAKPSLPPSAAPFFNTPSPTAIPAPPPPSFQTPMAPTNEPSRFGTFGTDRDVGPRNGPPMPIPGGTAEAQEIEGWRVIDVVAGRALIDGGFIGRFEVEPGMELPEIGVVQSIYLSPDGWVVATSRGIITDRP